MTLVLLALAGGLGAACRFLLDSAIARRNRWRIPMGTLVINVSGSLVLGLLAGVVAGGRHGMGASDVKAVLGTGFCGGYTTFSTTSVETVRLWSAEGQSRGVGYGVLTLVASVAAAAVGLGLGSLV